MITLPDGRRGQVCALLLLAAVLGLAWFALIAPLNDWFDARSEHLAERRSLLVHMKQLTGALPVLRQAVGSAGAGTIQPSALLGGDSDAIAGAALQGMVQDMATAAGAGLSSAEALAGEQQGEFRRIGLRVALSGDWSVMVAMLQAVESSQYRLLVDDLQLHATARIQLGPATGAPPIDAGFVVVGFRPGHEGRPPNTAAGTDLRTVTALGQ